MDIRVAINDEVEQQIIAHDEVVRLVRAVLTGEECLLPCEVSVSFVTVEQIHELNREYRGIDKPTDVLSFNIDDPDDFEEVDCYDEDNEDDDWGREPVEDDKPVGEDGRDWDDEAEPVAGARHADWPEDANDLDEPDVDDDSEDRDADNPGASGGDGDLELDDEFDDAFMLGDVIICPQIVEAQAADFGNSAADEMRLLLTHGCLHLMGYDHEDPAEAEEMESLERWYLEAFASVPVEQINVGPTVDHAAEGTAAVPRG